MIHRLRRSLALSASLLIVAAAACGVLMTLVLADRLANDRLENEARAIEALAERRVADRFSTEIELTKHRLHMLAAAIEDGLAIVAGEPATREAISRGNRADIANAIGADMNRLGLTAGLMLDHRLRVLGGAQPGIDAEQSNSVLAGHDLHEAFRELLDTVESSNPTGLRRFMIVDPLLARAFDVPAGIAVMLIAMPVFSHGGDVAGLVAGIRPIRRSEPVLSDLARTIGVGLSLHSEGRLVSGAGDVSGRGPDLEPNANGLIRLDVEMKVARCGSAFGIFDICVCRHLSEISAFRDEMTAIGLNHSRRASFLLAGAGFAGLLLLGYVALHVARRFTKPLIEISHSLDRIAAGGWREFVPHATREDEIGRIGRAVSSMQSRLEERDRMQVELARIDALNQRRLVLASALTNFELGISGVMRNLTATLHAMGSTKVALEGAARDAGRQVDRIRDTSEATANSAQAMSGATMQLSLRIQEVGERAKLARDAVQRSASGLDKAGQGLGDAVECARIAGGDVARFQTLVADIAAVMLATSRELGATNVTDATAALAFGQFSERAGAVAEQIETEIGALRSLVEQSASAIDHSRSVLDSATREAGEISVAAAEQGAATRDIAAGLTQAAEAITALVASVEDLRKSLDGANGATEDFVSIAHRIIEDARLIDDGVRTFVRDAAA